MSSAFQMLASIVLTGDDSATGEFRFYVLLCFIYRRQMALMINTLPSGLVFCFSEPFFCPYYLLAHIVWILLPSPEGMDCQMSPLNLVLQKAGYKKALSLTQPNMIASKKTNKQKNNACSSAPIHNSCSKGSKTQITQSLFILCRFSFPVAYLLC